MFDRLMKSASQGMRGPAYGNVHELERTASTIAGLGMLVKALRGPGLVRRVAWAGLGGMLFWRGVTGHCHIYSALRINTARPSNVERAGSDAVSSMPLRQGVHIEESIVIDRTPHEVFEAWRDVESFPRFMRHVESVRRTGAGRTHWVAKAPLGNTVQWDAEIHTQEIDRVISWRSLDGSGIANAGSVRFVAGDRPDRTVVKVDLKYNPPGGQLAAMLARLLGEEPRGQIRDDLRRFKGVVETTRVDDQGIRATS